MHLEVWVVVERYDVPSDTMHAHGTIRVDFYFVEVAVRVEVDFLIRESSV